MLVLALILIALWATATAAGTLQTLLLVNGAVQMVWFVLVAAIPTSRTGRMSWVDIAWPWGVLFIGVTAAALGDGALPRRIAVGAVYSFIGLRMGIAAIAMGRKTGVIFEHDFPRYRYRLEKLQEAGVHSIRAHMVLEVLVQGFANASVLAFPAFLLVTNADAAVSPLELAGLGHSLPEARWDEIVAAVVGHCRRVDAG
jgi:steroid 5-alpha reductase family enzyme